MRYLLREQAALHLHARNVAGIELILQKFLDYPRVDRIAAGKDIHGRVTVFRPRVDRYVRLRNDHSTADAVRTKGVECVCNNGCTRQAYPFEKNLADTLLTVEDVPITVVELDQNLSSKCLH